MSEITQMLTAMEQAQSHAAEHLLPLVHTKSGRRWGPTPSAAGKSLRLEKCKRRSKSAADWGAVGLEGKALRGSGRRS